MVSVTLKATRTVSKSIFRTVRFLLHIPVLRFGEMQDGADDVHSPEIMKVAFKLVQLAQLPFENPPSVTVASMGASAQPHTVPVQPQPAAHRRHVLLSV
jgi:hypothetical protein